MWSLTDAVSLYLQMLRNDKPFDPDRTRDLPIRIDFLHILRSEYHLKGVRVAFDHPSRHIDLLDGVSRHVTVLWS